MHLTKSEQQIMEIFWQADHPMAQTEVIHTCEDRKWKERSIFSMLNSVMAKGVLREVGFVRSGKTYARTFEPAISHAEYLALVVAEQLPAKQFPELLASLLQRVEITPAIQKALRAAVRENGPQAREAAAAKAVQGPKSTGFRKTGSTAPTPGRQILLDSTMAANPKLTKAMRAASKRAAERDLQAAVASKNGTSDGTTGVTNAKNAKKSGHNNATMSRYAHREKFVKDMKKDYTIVAPQMSPIHFSLVESVIRSGGYKFDILKHASREDVETGLKYVNNDACYPAIMVIGQLIDAILEGKYDPDKVCLAITQTGGMCRATNYFGLIRKALIDAGYPQIPVIAISTQGLEDNPGFKVTPALLHRTVKALCAQARYNL